MFNVDVQSNTYLWFYTVHHKEFHTLTFWNRHHKQTLTNKTNITNVQCIVLVFFQVVEAKQAELYLEIFQSLSLLCNGGGEVAGMGLGTQTLGH